MIKKENIEYVLGKADGEGYEASEKDIAFIILQDKCEDKGWAYNMIFGDKPKTAKLNEYIESAKIKFIAEMLKPFGIGITNTATISREQNKAELISLLKDIEEAQRSGDMETKDALKLKTDIRVKLNDKFDMEEDEESKHIIVVPSKHDIICPHTNRECTYMPTKEACMKYYKFKG